MNRALRTGIIAACSGLIAATLTGAGVPGAARDDGPAAAKPTNPVYFVHGYNDGGDTNCGAGNESGVWSNALDYFRNKWDGEIDTIGFYSGDTHCKDLKDFNGDGKGAHASPDTRIKDIAADFAHYIDSKDEADIDIVAHSMGGLITRVALIGSAGNWGGFPDHALNVADVVTLGTPHQGVIQKFGEKRDDTQWESMKPSSEFMRVLHAEENRLSDKWSHNPEWSFVASNEDDTVTGESAMDKDFFADHKYLYRGGNKDEVTHTGIRSLTEDNFNLRYWHQDTGEAKDTADGWAPVETAFNAVSRKGW